MSMNNMNVIHLNDTDFHCKICNTRIRFNVNDDKSYMQKGETDSSFIGLLTRYMFKHEAENFDHVNVVIVDQNNQYRGHKDFYVLDKHLSSILDSYKNISPEKFQLVELTPKTHTILELFLVVELNGKTILEFVNTHDFKTTTIVSLIIDFLMKNKSLYNKLPEYMLFEYLQKKYHIFMKDEYTFLVVLFTSRADLTDAYKQVFDILKTELSTVSEQAFFNTIITLVLKILDVSPNVNMDAITPYIRKIVTNPLYYSSIKLHPKIQNKIHEITNRIASVYPCTLNVLAFLSNGPEQSEQKSTLIELLSMNVADFRCIMDVIEYIAEREIYTQNDN